MAKGVVAVAARLTAEFGRGYTDKNLRHMIRFAEAFPDKEIGYALGRQLSWTLFRSLIYLDDPLKCDFYAEMCRIERWNTRTLQKKIGGMPYERTALSRKPEQLAREGLALLRAEDRLTPDPVFRDPCVLDFLQLEDTCSEKDLEAAILCAGESEKHVELLQIDQSGIRVATYLTELPPRPLVEPAVLPVGVVHRLPGPFEGGADDLTDLPVDRIEPRHLRIPGHVRRSVRGLLGPRFGGRSRPLPMPRGYSMPGGSPPGILGTGES